MREITYSDGTQFILEGPYHIQEARGGFYVIGAGYKSSRLVSREQAETLLEALNVVRGSR